jgi:hypothetical protein
MATPDRQALFCVYGACSDCDDAALEQFIIGKVNAPAAVAAE